MKPIAVFLLTVIVLSAVAGCASSTPVDNGTRLASATAVTAQSTEDAPADFTQIGFDLMAAEAIGDLRLNMKETQLLAAIGQPDSKEEPAVWGADGMEHSTWNYESKGFYVNMTKQPNSTDEPVVYTIYALAPCDLATQRGIRIGDTKEAVLAAYGNEIDKQYNTDTDQLIIAGSPYGGLQFDITDGLVSSIFIGAGAE